MRGSHGSSAQCFSLAVIPGGSDVPTSSPDINGGTIIGEAGLRIIDGGGGNGDRLLNASRRAVDRVLVLVSGGYNDGDTAVVKLRIESLVSGVTVTFYPPSAYRSNSLVHNCRPIASEAHRSNRGTACPPCFSSDPVNAGDTVVR